MRMVEVNWRPDDRQLRQFGWVALVMLPLAGWLFAGRPLSWVGHETAFRVITGLAIIGAVMALMGMARPQSLRPIFIGACLVAMPIGLLVSELLLLAVYFGVFLPMALAFRLLGRDALTRRFDRAAPTYWQPKAQPSGIKSYLRQS